MAGKIAHAAERKGFELALNGVMKRAQGNRNEGYVEVINAIEKVLGDGWPPQAYENLRTAFLVLKEALPASGRPEKMQKNMDAGSRGSSSLIRQARATSTARDAGHQSIPGR